MEFQLHILSRQDVNVPIGTNHVARVVYDLRWRVVTTIVTTDLASILLHMDQQLTALLDGVYLQHTAQPEDRIGLKLIFEGEESKPFGQTCKLAENPLARLLEKIGKLLQSNESLHMKRWNLTVDIFRNPTGGGKRTRSSSSVSAKSSKKPRRNAAEQFLLQVQEEDCYGRNVNMSHDIDADEDDDGDLSDFIVSDGHMSDDEEDPNGMYAQFVPIPPAPPLSACMSPPLPPPPPPPLIRRVASVRTSRAPLVPTTCCPDGLDTWGHRLPRIHLATRPYPHHHLHRYPVCQLQTYHHRPRLHLYHLLASRSTSRTTASNLRLVVFSTTRRVSSGLTIRTTSCVSTAPRLWHWPTRSGRRP